jgi:cellulose synthase (UDP-forming)
MSASCLGAVASTLRARLPLRQRVQFLLSSMYFLTGWTYLVYMLLPVLRILTGQQALAGATANQFLAHFAPYFAMSMLTVAIGGAGAYTFGAFALMEANFWIHIEAALRSLLRRKNRFVVTPKIGRTGRQPRAVMPALAALAVLAATAGEGLTASQSPGMLNNVAFATLHILVLLVGVWPALTGVKAAVRTEEIPRRHAIAA